MPIKSGEPYIKWSQMRELLETQAKTMTAKEMAQANGSSICAMRAALNRLKINPVALIVDWSPIIDDIRERAKTMNARQLAEHYKVKLASIYSTLSNYKIKAVSNLPKPKICLDDLTRLAPTMTNADLMRHFQISDEPLRKHLKRLGLASKKFEPGHFWQTRKQELKEKAAAGWTLEQLAEHYDRCPSTLRQVLSKFSISIRQANAQKKAPIKPRKPKAKPVKQAKPKRQELLIRRDNQALTPKEPRKPPTVVMPDNVKFTRFPFKPGADARVCNGSSTESYKPALHGGATTSYRR